MITDFISYLEKHQRAVKTWAVIGIVLLLIWSLVGVDTHHAHTWFEKHIHGFWSIFCVLSCLVLIFFARWFGGSGIMTREDYYDN